HQAYHHPHWTRRDAPLLDYMGAVIDHKEAHRSGGKSDESNLVTACCKCNALKSDAKFEIFEAKLRRHIVKGKCGEPEHWDGLSALFAILVERACNRERLGTRLAQTPEKRSHTDLAHYPSVALR